MQVVAAATRAPSIHTTQPWRFTATAEQLDVFLDPDRSLPVLDPSGRRQVISCGSAVEFAVLALAARRRGGGGGRALRRRRRSPGEHHPSAAADPAVPRGASTDAAPHGYPPESPPAAVSGRRPVGEVFRFAPSGG